MIETILPSSSFVENEGKVFSTTSATLNFHYDDDDPNSTSSQAASDGWVKYNWDGKSEQTWDGTDFAVPTAKGPHVLRVNASDSFGQYMNFSFDFTVAETITDTTISDSVSYENETLLCPTISIQSGGSLDLMNCTLLTLEGGDTITVHEGAYLNISGPDDDTSSNQSVVSSSGNGMSVITGPGSNFNVFDTKFSDWGTSPNDSTLLLHEGIIESSTIMGAKTSVSIKSIGVSINDTVFSGNNTSVGVMVDVNHSWADDATKLTNLTFTGDFHTPVRIINNSAWKPFDVEDLYYLDEGNNTLSFSTPSSEDGYTDPYLYLPHYLDSRDPESILFISYLDTGGWVTVPGTLISDTVFDDWLNGDDAMIDLSSIPQGTRVNVTFNASDSMGGRLYTGVPYIGGSNKDPVRLNSNNFAGFVNDWLSQKVEGASLIMDNISIENASHRFIDIESSGMIRINNLRTGTGGSYPELTTQIEIEGGSVIINGSSLKGNDDLSHFIHAHMAGENDYPCINITETEFSSFGYESMTGINAQMVRMELKNLSIRNISYGINGEEALLRTDSVDIEASSYGAYIEMPDTYERDVDLSMKGISVSGDFQYGGIHIEGDIDYNLFISLTDMDIASTYNETTFERGDGYGGIYLELDSTQEAFIEMEGYISDGPWHGISIDKWPSQGMITILKGTICSNMELDGIWTDTEVDLLIEESVSMNQNGGWGLYGYTGSEIQMEGASNSYITIRNNEMGGILAQDYSDLKIEYADIAFNDGYAIDMRKGVTCNISWLEAQSNNFGVKAIIGSKVIISSSEITGTLTGDGLYMAGVDLTITGSTPGRTYITENNQRGLFMDGGSLNMELTNLDENGLDGISLWGVDVTHFSNVVSSDNGGAGLTAHVDDLSLLDTEKVYFRISRSQMDSNLGKGLTVTFDPTSLPGGLTMELERVKIFNNTGGDIISSSQVLYVWNMMGADQLGTPEYRGETFANLEITVMSEKIGEILNEEIYFLARQTPIVVEESAQIFIQDSTIRPMKNTDSWSIEATSLSRVSVTGSYFAYMDTFQIDGANSLNLDETQLINNEGGLNIRDTRFTINTCQFTNINGNAISLRNSTGSISNSGITGSTMGVFVNGLQGDLNIDKTTFTDNSWGLYVFLSNDNSTIRVTDSVFVNGDNQLAPIWTKADIILEDTDIDPYEIIVDSADVSVSIFYTLTINVVDEEERSQVFDINLKVGQSPSSIVSSDNPGTWSQSFRSYLVTNTRVDKSRESLRFTISYSDTTNSEVKEGYIIDSLVLNQKTTRTYYGFEKPWLTPEGSDNDIIYAEEDKGLVGGPIDISGWFTDLGTDKGNLTYSVESMTDQIEATLIGSILSINTEENWNGPGKIRITVTDPHGKQSTFDVNVDVRPMNDLPWITDPKIEVIGGKDNIPRSGDSIKAVWTWNDIDENDYETYTRIQWYLNGTLMPEKNNMTIIGDLKAGQIWNFKIWPSDQDTPNDNVYGEPVSSSPVVVQSIGPKWTSDLTVNSYTPTTDMDIIVSPGTFDDPDSSLVTYNYLWEVKKGSIFTPIGAPNTPILDHRFTTKGEEIRVKVWLHDGITSSDVKTALFTVRNSAPEIISATLTPSIIREDDDILTVKDVVVHDADGDPITLYYEWRVGDISVPVNNEIPYLTKTQGSWSYPGRANITVVISCFDNDNQEGEPLTLSANFLPTDSDGDGIFDDVNGDGDNDPGDDDDDDNDGFYDDWEIFLGTDPLNPLSTPLDTDGDGIPDGDPENSMTWMDIDDDEDNIEDSEDSYPKNGALPGDFDLDGIGDDKDSDIDGDGVDNDDDYDPYNPNVTSAPEEPGQSVVEILIFILLIIIILAIGLGIYGVATGYVKLPSTAPPQVGEDEGAEAIFEEDEEGKTSGKEDLEELEDVDNMSVCSVCGELIGVEEENCPNCGAVFDDMEEEDLEFEEDEEEDD